jgi:hypothetical protein
VYNTEINNRKYDGLLCILTKRCGSPLILQNDVATVNEIITVLRRHNLSSIERD